MRVDRKFSRGFVSAMLAGSATLLFSAAVAAAEPAPWALCSKELADEAATSLAPERRRQCVIAVAGTYLLWVRGELDAADMPLAADFRRRVIGTARSEATTDRAALLADTRPGLIASATEHEWLVEGDTAWATFTVTLKASPGDVHWIAERFTLSDGRISDIMALPPVQKR